MLGDILYGQIFPLPACRSQIHNNIEGGEYALTHDKLDLLIKTEAYVSRHCSCVAEISILSEFKLRAVGKFVTYHHKVLNKRKSTIALSQISFIQKRH